MTEPNNNSREHTAVPASNLTKKDIDKLLGLFRQLEKMSKLDRPPKNKKLWMQCLKKEKDEFLEDVKKQKSRFTIPPRGRFPLKKPAKQMSKNETRSYDKLIIAGAEKKYHEKDPVYADALNRKEKQLEDIIKEIDHALYSIREPLLKFDRARGTLLEADCWKQIRDRDKFYVSEIMHFLQSQDVVEKAIDALEAIKRKVKRQRWRYFKSCLLKLYEVTLKVIVDAVMERFWPKPK